MQNRRNSLLPDHRNTRPAADQVDHCHTPEARSQRYTTARRRASGCRANLIHGLTAASLKGCELRRSAAACVLLFVMSGFASAQIIDQTDNQFWADVQVAVPM